MPPHRCDPPTTKPACHESLTAPPAWRCWRIPCAKISRRCPPPRAAGNGRRSATTPTACAAPWRWPGTAKKSSRCAGNWNWMWRRRSRPCRPMSTTWPCILQRTSRGPTIRQANRRAARMAATAAATAAAGTAILAIGGVLFKEYLNSGFSENS
ncbi:protein of unknown function (plasmid) [Cupriavidus taiwanensis]|uniref:Uncharacterized protein n=1 Tax=Cupriavidus taiwanensis TaxID=164546 RepID=A0A9Q7V147_9BURK|nr:protein of unknown function [Cupriavidus taiwanensis]